MDSILSASNMFIYITKRKKPSIYYKTSRKNDDFSKIIKKLRLNLPFQQFSAQFFLLQSHFHATYAFLRSHSRKNILSETVR